MSHKKEYSLLAVTFWLAFGGFAIGASEFAAMGLLPYFANDFNISEDVAGTAISAYALGVVVGAPLITVFCSRFPRKYMLVALMLAYTCGNLLTAFATDITFMNLARFISGLPHGAYFGIAMLFAADIAGRAKRAEAVSHILLGLAIANVIGVPVINAIGQYLGWRSGFYLITALAAITFIMIWKTAPYRGWNRDANPLTELGALKNKNVLLVLLMSAIGFGGMFSVYSFASATYLENIGNPEWGVNIILLCYGLGITLGNYLAGKVAGGRLLIAALGFQLVLGIAGGVYAVSVHNGLLMGLALFLVGFGGGMTVPLQTRLMDVAGNAQSLAGAANQAAFNVANAIGPWLAGMAVTGTRLGWAACGYVAIALSLAGVVIWIALYYTDPFRKQKQPATAKAAASS